MGYNGTEATKDIFVQMMNCSLLEDRNQMFHETSFGLQEPW